MGTSLLPIYSETFWPGTSIFELMLDLFRLFSKHAAAKVFIRD